MSFERAVVRGTTQNTYQEFERTIPAGESMQELYYDYNYFRILELSGAGPLYVRFGDNSQETPFIGTGIGYNADFVMPRLNIRNGGSGPVNLRFAVAIGEITDDRINFDPAAVLPVEQKQAAGIVTSAVSVLTTATQILAADPDRLYASITPTNGQIYIGDASVTTAAGFLLQSGTTYSLDTIGAVYAIAAAATNVRVLEGLQ